jgi:G3E family GTPase
VIAFTVIGGYLGAGKTTLLNHLLANSEDKRIGLLINDFGEINIDADLIASKTDSQINLTNGCVCCTLVDGFHVAIDQLCEVEPPLEQIVVEASGVADVHNLAQYGHGPDMQLDAVLVVADAETIQAKAKDKYVAGTIQRQLRAADLIILNKTDLLSDSRVAAVLAWLQHDFPEARVFCTSRARVPLPLLLGIHDLERPMTTSDHPHAHYATWHFEQASPVTRESVDEFLAGLNASVLRAKGFARLQDGTAVTIQVVGRRSEIETTDKDISGVQLVAIGLADLLDNEALDKLARSRFA